MFNLSVEKTIQISVILISTEVTNRIRITRLL